MDGGQDGRDTRYQQAAAQFGRALERLARAYERDPDLARDLLQDIHLALWRSLDGFDGRAALRTWVFRLAHNTGATHTLRQRRSRPGKPVSLEELDGLAAPDNARTVVDAYRDALVRQYRGAAAFWRRDLPLFLPGLILIYAGRYRQDHVGGRPLDLDHTFIILGGVIGLLMLAIVVLVSLLGAARLQNQINDLDRMLRG
ncbi:RNA polymerase, sigma-24 subunit [Nitrospirillum viridazoti Y2]|uniref:Sigma-70-like protein n=1 Tax=Nitrospirillum amazonense TaxID=28077 RepID=A0A560HNR7_9PROT|nr:sigma factor [Nitrospirillum amazonense]EGY00073.1 RNA polymerase, sigma-24 subunit [Nitrospirillum amazonense Y2]TWB48206.1 sigma-70-like protein [Nitrospirillum amazonense]